MPTLPAGRYLSAIVVLLTCSCMGPRTAGRSADSTKPPSQSGFHRFGPPPQTDYGTALERDGLQFRWRNAGTGIPTRTEDYACSSELQVAIDSTSPFVTEEIRKCPNGASFYKFSWGDTSSLIR
jgi:hypothetical protein